VAVDYGDLLTDENVANNRARHVHAGQNALIIKRHHWQVVDLESIGHEANAVAVLVEVSEHYDFVAELEQTLG
jgi:hypothetical protein